MIKPVRSAAAFVSKKVFPSKTNYFNIIACALALIAILAAYIISIYVFEQMPHVEDEMAYVWQAEAFAKGKLTMPSPPDAPSIMIPFVVDYHSQRFSKYPFAWSLVLAFGLLLNARAWVNPIFAGICVWLTYRLGKKLFDARVALLAAFLTLVSPFFIFRAGMLFAHPWALFLSLSFVLAWLDSVAAREEDSIPAWITVSVAGISLGVMALTRPLTAVGLAIPFSIHGLILLARGDSKIRFRVLVIGLIAFLVASLLFVWQFAVTGDPFLNPYTLWWKYDKVGFGEGYGRQTGGHSLHWALENLYASFDMGGKDFFGWGNAWWFFPALGLISLKKNWRAWLVVSAFPALVLIYMTYWTYHPRYYYEGFYSLALSCAAGIFFLAEGIFKHGRGKKMAQFLTISLCAALFIYSFLIYFPTRWNELTGLYGIQRSMLAPFETEEARARTPALVIVHVQKVWVEYGGLLELQNVDLTSPFIFAFSRGELSDIRLERDYPSRRILHYYADDPWTFYDAPR